MPSDAHLRTRQLCDILAGACLLKTVLEEAGAADADPEVAEVIADSIDPLVDQIWQLNPGTDSRRGRGVRVCGMQTGISLSITHADLDRLHALVKDRNAPQKHVWPAQIVLLTAVERTVRLSMTAALGWASAASHTKQSGQILGQRVETSR
jgi:hypothetical protein